MILDDPVIAYLTFTLKQYPAALLPSRLCFLKLQNTIRVSKCPKTTRVGRVGPGRFASICQVRQTVTRQGG